MSDEEQPLCAAKAPAVVEVDPGVYWWCVCGRSKQQPWCDGSHVVTEFEPEMITVSERKKLVLCQCKQSKNPPFCDGTHKSL